MTTDKINDASGLEIYPYSSYNSLASFPLKLNFKIVNGTSKPIALQSKNFEFNQNDITLDPNVLPKFIKPMILTGINKSGKDVYDEIAVFKPGESAIACWIPLNPKKSEKEVNTALENKKLGVWTYNWWILDNPPMYKEEHKIV